MTNNKSKKPIGLGNSKERDTGVVRSQLKDVKLGKHKL